MPSIEVVLDDDDVPLSHSGEEVDPTHSSIVKRSKDSEDNDGQDPGQSKKQMEIKANKKGKPSSCLADLEQELLKQQALVEEAIGMNSDKDDTTTSSPTKQLAELEQELLLRRKLVEQALSAVGLGRQNLPEIIFNDSAGRSQECGGSDEKKDDGSLRAGPEDNESSAPKSWIEKGPSTDIGMESPTKTASDKEYHQEMSPAVISVESTAPSSATGDITSLERDTGTMGDSPAEVSLDYSMSDDVMDVRASLNDAFVFAGSLPEEEQTPATLLDSNKAGVFVKDEIFGWLPARVLESQDEFAFVTIEMPQNWRESTIVQDDETGDSAGNTKGIHKTMESEKEALGRIVRDHKVLSNTVRRVIWKDYKNGILPLQNDQVTKPDMVDLEHLHEAAIMFNLKERHLLTKPYTRVGDIMVAVNPFMWINELYTPQTQERYTRELIWQDMEIDSKTHEEDKSYFGKLGVDPHVYEVSSLAYRGLAMEGKDQTILVAGESGAGKTETVKIVMSHLATIPQTRCESQAFDSSHEISQDIVTKICESSPIFEAFGNAKTLRNDNSSRFGKFTQLQFEMEGSVEAKRNGRVVPYTDLVGSLCTTYLLEKSRVVSTCPGERTYHIFYQLLASPQEFKRKMLPHFEGCTVDDFKYTGDLVQASLVAHSDAQMWEETEKALSLFQFQGQALLDLMRILAIVLQLGNLSFDQDAASEYEEHNSFITSKMELERLSMMIGIDSAELEDTMTCRVLKTGSDVVKVKASPQVAKEWCDALAKEIYARTFDLMVQKINEHTAVDEKKEKRKIGHVSLLDIFGFESLKVNGFEQLCINYANEKLQKKYILDNFNRVKEEYEAEEIDLYDFALVDNSDILDLLEGPSGLVVSLNEECHLPAGKNEKFVFKAKKNHKGVGCFIDEKLHQKTEFGVRHFAGSVIYDARKFVERNMDKLPDGLVDCAAKSTNSLIRAQFEASLSPHSESTSLSKRASIRRDRCVLEKFQNQLRNLMGAFEETRTFYIRCIKPNNDRLPQKTDHNCVTRQLKCSGIMTAIAMTRECFPSKLDYDSILDRYGCLMRESVIRNIGEMQLQQNKVEYALSKLLRSSSRKNRDGSTTMPFSCGKTNIYFKAGAQERLEILRTEYLTKEALVIQSWLKTDQYKERSSRRRRNATKIQKQWRMVLGLSKFKSKKVSATRIQSQHRARDTRRQLQAARDAAMILQKAVRNAQRRQAAATKINAGSRGFLALRRAKARRHERDSAIAIQTMIRRLSAKKLADAKKTEANGKAQGNRGASNDQPENWFQAMIERVLDGCVCGGCPIRVEKEADSVDGDATLEANHDNVR